MWIATPRTSFLALSPAHVALLWGVRLPPLGPRSPPKLVARWYLQSFRGAPR